jgi:hypothetical protein
MALEKNKITDIEDDVASAGGGRIFAAGEESAQIANLDEDIEKNIRIRVMPRKFKISSRPGDKKTTIIGAVIMIVGFIVLSAAVYLSYVYLIKSPQSASVNNSSSETKDNISNSSNLNSSSSPSSSTKPVSSPVSSATSTPIIASSTASSTISSTASSTASSSISQIASSTASSTALSATTTAPAVSSLPASSILANGDLPAGAKVDDSDSDGLSGSEETIFGSDSSKVDTDGDGYSDSAEVLNLYNPAGAGKITDNPHIAVFSDSAAKFTVDYPKIWQMQNLNSGQTVIFSSSDNSFIEVVAMSNSTRESIKDWYNSQFPDDQITDSDVVLKNGWQGVFHQSRKIFYLTDLGRNNIYTISYVPSSDSNLDFYRIFLIAINSFTVK